MIKTRYATIGFILPALFAVSVVFSGTFFSTGERVYAQWKPNAWYAGKVEGTCTIGWEVLFDDGDRKCCSRHHIAADRVPAEDKLNVGARVLALWTDGRYYPGIIAELDGGRYFIQFDDGDTRTVLREEIRLLAPPG